jgi:alpha/beta superfamily hydrolase
LPALEVGICVETLSHAGFRTGVLDRRLRLADLHREPIGPGLECVVLRTARGDITCCLHEAADAASRGDRLGAILVGGASAGLLGPADELYPELSQQLAAAGVTPLRLDYRYPNALPECVLDVLLGIAFLNSEGVARVALVGHSFGGAVVISAGAFSPEVHAVVTLSTQTYGADLVGELSPRPLLLMHGTSDEVLPSVCSELVYAAAREPRELRLLSGARHDLSSAREELLRTLSAWLPDALQRAETGRATQRSLELRDI